MGSLPKGVRYEYRNDQSVDYQVFPEEYFSGSDVTIYFGDVWVDDITGISFELQEQVQPIFGYNSYTWDAVARGQRLIQGTFSIAFREAGYLSSLILDHIAQLKDPRPALAWMMDKNNQAAGSANDYVPKWSAKARERIDELLTRYHAPMRSGTEVRPVVPNWPTITPGGSNPQWAVKQLAEALFKKKDASGNSYYPSYNPAQAVWTYDTVMQAAVQRMQQDHAVGDPAGVVGASTRDALAVKQLVSVQTFDQTKSLEGTGVHPEATVKARTAAYEAEVWGLDAGAYQGQTGPIPLRAMRRFKPYWYSGEHTSALAQKGFDIYFSFGALDAYAAENKAIIQSDYQSPNKDGGISFPSTVRALRNVQIMGLGMALDASGQPVEEIYRFIAQDLD